MSDKIIPSPPQTEHGYYDYTGLSKEEITYRTEEGWNGPIERVAETFQKFGSVGHTFKGIKVFGGGPSNSEDLPLAMIGVSNYSRSRLDIEKWPSIYAPNTCNLKKFDPQFTNIASCVWRDKNTVYDVSDKSQIHVDAYYGVGGGFDYDATLDPQRGFLGRAIGEGFNFYKEQISVNKGQMGFGISFWMKGNSAPSGTNQYYGDVCRIGTSTDETQDMFYISSDNYFGSKMRFFVMNTGITVQPSAMYDGQWHHWMVNVDYYANPQANIYVYRDNVLHQSITGIDTTLLPVNNFDKIWFYRPNIGPYSEPPAPYESVPYISDLRLYWKQDTLTILDADQRTNIYTNYLPHQIFDVENFSASYIQYSGAGQLAELFTRGFDTSTGSIPLYLETTPLPTNSLPLSLWGGSTTGTAQGFLPLEKVWPIDNPVGLSLADENNWGNGVIAFWPLNEAAGKYSHNNAWSKYQGSYLQNKHRNWSSTTGINDLLDPDWDYDDEVGRCLTSTPRYSGGDYYYDYAEISGYSGSIDCTGAMTINAWVKTLDSVRHGLPPVSNNGVYGPIISWNSSGGYDLRIVPDFTISNPAGNIRFAINGHTYGDVIAGGLTVGNSLTYDDTAWHNIVAVVENISYSGADSGSGSGTGTGGSGTGTGIDTGGPPVVEGVAPKKPKVFGGKGIIGDGGGSGTVIIGDGSGNGSMKLYLDGKLIAEGPCTLPIRYQSGEAPRLMKEGTELGVDGFDTSNHELYRGGLKDIRVVRDRSWSADEVWDNFSSARKTIYRPAQIWNSFSGVARGTETRLMTLWMYGSFGTQEDLNLYINGGGGTLLDSSGLPLYLHGFQPLSTSYIPMHIESFGETTEDLNLWIGGIDYNNYSINLNMIGVPTVSGCGQLNELFMKVWNPQGGVNEDLNLFVNCPSTPISGSWNLFIAGDENVNWVKDVPLYIHPCYQELWMRGKDTYTEDMNLYINSMDVFNNNFPLVISTIEKGGFDMWTKGFELSSEDINLFLQSNPITDMDKSTDLYLFSTTNNGFYAGIDLYMKVPEVDGFYEEDMPLYLETVNHLDFDDSMNLYIEGRWAQLTKGCDFFVENGYSGVNNTIDLWITGSGELDGYIPVNDSMNLFINTPIGYWVPVYLSGDVNRASGNIPMYLEAQAGTGTKSADLVMPNVTEPKSKSGNLFTRGW